MLKYTIEREYTRHNLFKEIESVMGMLLERDLSYRLPRMHRVRQLFAADEIEDVQRAALAQLSRADIREKVRPGMRVAVAVGSRGIANIGIVVKAAVDRLAELGAIPFVLSAMGSHGGGTPEGQRSVLAGYGVTEECLGVPVVTNVKSECIGHLKDGLPVYFDCEALRADMVIPINRVKLHTDFVGPLQSGLCKMLVIGLGNQEGCSTIHERAPEEFAAILEEAARLIMERVNVGFGIALIDNAYHKTAWVEAVPNPGLIEREKELVILSKRFMPALMIPKIDVLVVEQIGKNISGCGFDPQVIGHSPALKTPAVPVPEIGRMVLLGLSEESHGVAVGMGMFDVMLRSVLSSADLEATYINTLSAKLIEEARIPMMAQTEDEAIRIAVKAQRNLNKAALKIVKIRSTLALEEIWVSDALLSAVKENPRMELVPQEWQSCNS